MQRSNASAPMVLPRTPFTNAPPQTESTSPGATALIDYDRIRPEVESTPDGRFNWPLLRRQLSSMGVSNSILVASSVADQSVIDVAARLGFHSVLMEAKAGNWMSHALACERARTRESGARDLVLVGATADDAEAIRALRAGGASVTVVHWPRAFDMELVWMAGRCIPLGPDFILDPIGVVRHLLGQAN